MTNHQTSVLLVGATGVFGRLLARQLMCERGIQVVLAGRTLSTLEALRDELGDGPCGTKGCPADLAVLDRNVVTAEALRKTGAAIIIDAAGPFQDSRTTLIEAAIAAGCHYIDLADGRDFVTGITRFDADAKAKGVAVIAGASTSPALTNAAADDLTRGWRRIDTLRVALSLGSRAPRGLSVVQAALSYAGQKIRVLREGRWTSARGWSGTRKVTFPGLGDRLVSLCDTPDLDLLAARFKPRVTVEFLGGLEQPSLQRTLSVVSWLSRLPLIKSLKPLSKLGRRYALLFSGLGTDRGGLVVEAKGRDRDNHPVIARWSLAGAPGQGPYVPTLPALALVRRIHHGALDFTGAAPCTGFVTLQDFAADFARIGVTTQKDVTRPAEPIFATALGDAFSSLFLVTQDIHRPDPVLVLKGEAEVDGPTNLFGRLAARVFRFPPASARTPLGVIIEADADGTEHWSRVYPDQVMRSVMAAPDAATHSVEERFGLFRFRLKLDVLCSRLALVPVSARWGPIPIPGFLQPKIKASERAAGGRHHFDVRIALPIIGRLVHYRGWLAVDPDTRAALPTAQVESSAA